MNPEFIEQLPNEEPDVAIRCTYPKCACDCFSPTKSQIRVCQTCKHGWVAHALDKLITTFPYANLAGQTEAVNASLVFDLASLILYGCQAIPIRLKIGLDRLFSVLQHEEVMQVLHGFGWSYEDYARGYILQDPAGRVLEKFTLINREEEYIVLQQFLRFSESRTIAQEIILQETKTNQPDISQPQPAKADSDIRKFIERNNMALIQSYNLALRRAFDNPQSLFTAMSAFPAAHLNMAAAASQFTRSFPTAGALPIPIAVSAPTSSTTREVKPEPSTPVVEQQAPLAPQQRRVVEPYDLTKRSPESQRSSKSSPPCAPVSSQPVIEERLSFEANGGTSSTPTKRSSPPPPVAVRSPSSPASSSKGSWPFSNPSFGQTVFVTSSGKKRVLCTACNKTFCDKGALKIHYSAVHLKEMHKCSIQGCNMMFSSRRSRNRHSANPNPKLHTPQTRRPRERYDSSHGHGMGILSLSGHASHECDESFTMDSEGKLMNAGSMQKEYRSTGASSPMPSDGMESCDDLEEGNEEYMDSDLPTQIQIKHESPLYGSNKRKRLMPIRVASGAHLGLDDDDDDDDDANSDAGESMESASPSLNGADERLHRNSVDHQSTTKEEKEPGEISSGNHRLPIEPGEIVRHSRPSKRLSLEETALRNEARYCSSLTTMTEGKQPSAMHALFSSFLPHADNHDRSFWSRITSRNRSNEDKSDGASIHSDESIRSRDKSPEPSQLQIPLNPDNPRQCAACAKEFQNIFSVKLHYQNVHLKVQHQCTIEGCNASFPSKRSRDRHRRNINLHRKLIEANPSLLQYFDSCTNFEKPSDDEVDSQDEKDTNVDVECRFCNQRFNSEAILASHLSTVHQGQGQPPTFVEQEFCSALDSVKHNAPVVA